MYAIKTEKLTKKYKEKTAVSNLDLKINEGEMYPSPCSPRLL